MGRRVGGLIRSTAPTTSTSAASGVWAMSDFVRLRAANLWPRRIISVTLGTQQDAETREDPTGLVTNHGSDVNNYVQAPFSNRISNLAKFDLSAIPSSATILTAQLVLVPANYFSPSNTVRLFRLTRDWTEAGVTGNTYDGTNNWTTVGGDIDTGTVHASQTFSSQVNFNQDITALVQGWVNGTWSNYGYLLRAQNDNGFAMAFGSKENATPANRPSLTITYTE